RLAGELVITAELPVDQLRDDDWTFVRFTDVDLVGPYSLSFAAPAATVGVGISRGDTLPGDLLVSGKRVDGDLALRVEHCRPPLPAGWRVEGKGAGTLLIGNPAAGPGATLLDAAAWDA